MILVDRGIEFPDIWTKSVNNGRVNIFSYADHTQRRRKLVALSSGKIYGRHRLLFLFPPPSGAGFQELASMAIGRDSISVIFYFQ